VSFAAITLCVASQREFFVVYFVIDSVRKLLDIPSYCKVRDRVTVVGKPTAILPTLRNAELGTCNFTTVNVDLNLRSYPLRLLDIINPDYV
jgi:hypothetical protein